MKEHYVRPDLEVVRIGLTDVLSVSWEPTEFETPIKIGRKKEPSLDDDWGGLDPNW